MHIRFTNTDSAGDAVTQRITFLYDGERHTLNLSQRGTADVSDDVGEYLIESDNYDVESDEEQTRDDYVEESAEEPEPTDDAETDNEV